MTEPQDPMYDLRICYQRVPSIAKEEDIPPSNLVVAASNFSGPYELAIGKNKFWSPGQVLKVSWWGREEVPVEEGLKKKVKKFAKQWDAICNITLDFGDYGDDADIRIAFQIGQGSWSYVGRDNHLSPKDGGPKKDEPTMNFGWLTANSKDDVIQPVVLHEFGHALGCIHEHQNPDGGIKWNVPAVLDYFRGKPNYWDEDETKHNVLNPVATSMNSVFDPDSIMLYFFDARLTLDGKGTHENKQLSNMDRQYIKMLYPPQGHAAGVFDTKEVVGPAAAIKPEQQPQTTSMFNTKKFLFEPPYDTIPKLAIGLSRLEASCKANKAIAASVDSIEKDNVVVSINTWDTSVLLGGAANWVEAASTDSDWQFGVFDTQEQRDRNDTSSQTASKTIYFEEPYSSPPKVIVALKLIDLENHRDYRVKTYATDIQSDRFTIHIDTWGDSILYAGAATWIAYPADLKGTVSASVLSQEDKPKNSARLEFPKGVFKKKPEVRTFLNLIDTKCGADLRVKTYADQVTQDGMDWHADTWGDTKMHQAGVSILAWQ